MNYTIESKDDEFIIKGEIKQRRKPYYNVSAEVVVVGEGVYREIVEVSGENTPFSFSYKEKPKAVLFDPGYKILRWTPDYKNMGILREAQKLIDGFHFKDALDLLKSIEIGGETSLYKQVGIGKAYIGLDSLREAERALKKVVDFYETYPVFSQSVPEAHLLLGQINDLRGQRIAALGQYEKAGAMVGPASDLYEEIYKYIKAPYKRVEYKIPPKPEIYSGEFQLEGSNMALTVKTDDSGFLVIGGNGVWDFCVMRWLGADSFEANVQEFGKLLLNFLRDESGKIARLEADFHGHVLFLIRIE